MTSRPRKHGTRGAALVETSLVVGVILTLLLFAVQVGVLGFLQVTVDAASFVNARQNAVTVNTLGGPAAATNAIFPQVAQNNITTVALPAPSPSVPVDYGYNSSDATERANSVTNRHGGVSMLQPLLQQTTVTKPGLMRMFGFNVGVTAQATEPFWQECGAHDNVSNQAIGCGQANNAANYQVDYFQNGENTPPYYLSLNYIEHCSAAQPWTTCPSGSMDLLALGVGEYLTVNDWSRTNAGASGLAGSSTFSDMACHQRAFNQLATFFYAIPDIPTMYALWGTTLYNNVANNYPYSSFATFSGFDGATNAAVQAIYSWDRGLVAGYVPGSSGDPTQYPLTPYKNCT